MGAVNRVLIEGGGVGGLTLAAALGQRGVETDVVEAAGPDAVLGVRAEPASQRAGCPGRDRRAAVMPGRRFPFEELHFWNPEGVQVGALPPAAGVYQKPSNNAIGRPAYYGILQAAKQAGARIQTGVTIGDMTEHSQGVEVELATWTGKRTPALRDPDATSRRYDLVVGFDGARSRSAGTCSVTPTRQSSPASPTGG